ncbi:MAG: alpha-glucosidase C-terminal domain-containing protein [Rhodospirillales bacterium]|nr:alpha-glucosidase C-terminal domain-containing protein [Rhodospirillales bacterium]
MADDWWRGAVIYQVYPRSFCDANGDGIGDLAGISEKLPYVADLGVDAVWISPFFTSPMKDFGYDVADYCGVDPLFGSLADFDRLLEDAHRLGLKVIIDQVYSHTSDAHPWFEESRSSRTNPKADWYVWADPKPDGTAPNNWLSVFGGPAWDWEPRRKQYYFHNFLKEQPDLNFHNNEVQTAVLDAARFWLDRGVDGFRMDVANFFCHDPQLRDNPPFPHPNPVKAYWLQRQVYNRSRPETLDFVARFRACLDRYAGAMAVAEIASDHPVATTAAYTDGPDRYHTAYSFVFLRQTSGVRHIRDSIEEMLAAAPGAWPSWAFSNHDVPRVVSRWGDGANVAPAERAAFAKCLIAVLTCLRGTVFLYQGEELGLPQAFVPFERLQDPESRRFWPAYHARDGARTPMPWRCDAPHGGFSVAEPWLPLDPAHLALAVDRQQDDAGSVLAFTRRFLSWRREQPALITGDIHFLHVDDAVLAFERRLDRRRLLCAFNLSAANARFTLNESVAAVHATGLPGSVEHGCGVMLPPFGGVIAAMD